MKISHIITEDGKIVPGVNTTVDVQPGETERQAAKYFGNSGKPQALVSNKIRKNSDPNTLYNLGLAESVVWEREVKQSDPITVLNKVMDRRDPSAFPVKMYDGSTIGVTPKLAKTIVDVYDQLEPAKKKKVEWFLKTKNGFKELAQIVGNMTKAKINQLPESLVEHVEEAWSKKYKSSIDCNNPKGFSQKAHCAGRKKRK